MNNSRPDDTVAELVGAFRKFIISEWKRKKLPRGFHDAREAEARNIERKIPSTASLFAIYGDVFHLAFYMGVSEVQSHKRISGRMPSVGMYRLQALRGLPLTYQRMVAHKLATTRPHPTVTDFLAKKLRQARHRQAIIEPAIMLSKPPCVSLEPIFPEEVRRVIRSDNQLADAVITVPSVMPHAAHCLLSMTIPSCFVALVAKRLFNATVQDDEAIRYLVLGNISAQVLRITGITQEGLSWLGPRIRQAIEGSPHEPKDAVTLEVGGSSSTDGTLNLHLEPEYGIQLSKYFSKNK